jgi:hypothetical protein
MIKKTSVLLILTALFIINTTTANAKSLFGNFDDIKSFLFFSFFRVREVNLEIPKLPITAPVIVEKRFILEEPSPIPAKLELTPSASPKPTAQPTPIVLSFTSDNSHSNLLDEVNKYRSSQGLGGVSENPATCDFAARRADEISKDFSHNGFQDRVNAGSLPYSSYSKVVENIAVNPNPNKVVSRWISSPGHAANLRSDTPFACIRNHGDYYVYEGMRP